MGAGVFFCFFGAEGAYIIDSIQGPVFRWGGGAAPSPCFEKKSYGVWPPLAHPAPPRKGPARLAFGSPRSPGYSGLGRLASFLLSFFDATKKRLGLGLCGDIAAEVHGINRDAGDLFPARIIVPVITELVAESTGLANSYMPL